MSRKETPRAGLLKAAVAGQLRNAQVAQALAVSERHVQRLKQRYRAEGPAGLRHRSRGRPSGRGVGPDVRRRAAQLLQTMYRDLNDCHATEKLCEVDGLALSRATVQRLRRTLGLPAKHRRRARQYRARRTPAAQRGALVQVDASPFAWLEGRGPAMTLHGAIDDATGTVLALHFRPTEDLHGYTTLLWQLATTYGLPVALYGDRLNVFVRNDRHWSIPEQLQGEREPTHFGRMLRALGIGFIAAGSPQAKGRIERLWRTLQDRLTAELRLRDIRTLEAATAFLPAFLADFNRRFTRPPADTTAAWRPAPRELRAELSCRYHRIVGRDHTVRVGARVVQVLPRGAGRSLAGCCVEVRECLDGRLLVLHAGHPIAVQPSPDPAFVLKPRRAANAGRAPRRRAGTSSADESGRSLTSAEHARRAARAAMASSGKTGRRSSRPAPSHPWRHAAPLSRRARQRTLTPARGATFSLSS